MLQDKDMGKGFMNKTTKEKQDKLDYIKLKTFYTSKQTINKVKRQPSEPEKI